MGVVPIVDLSPLTLTRPDEPKLEPLLPIARVENSSANPDETYSPSEEQTASGPENNEPEAQCNHLSGAAEVQPSDTEQDQTHEINLFA